MIETPTVIVLGAGASMPFAFSSGQGLLDSARALGIETLRNHIRPRTAQEAIPLREALSLTAEGSIDAMLEYRPDLDLSGKALIARLLLQQERSAKQSGHKSDRDWLPRLFGRMGADSLDAFGENKVTFVTYNYDRLLEHRLVKALHVKFQEPLAKCASTLSKLGVLHLHGQLGAYPDMPIEGVAPVAYGGNEPDGVTDGDVNCALQAIQIVHQAAEGGPVFQEAWKKIQKCERLVFLGVGFAERNIKRLQADLHLHNDARIFACCYGVTEAEQINLVKPLFGGFSEKIRFGLESHDIVDFIRHVPQAFL